MSTTLELLRPEISALKPYKPADYVGGFIRLNANETPWRPPGDQSRDGLNRYPDPRPAELTLKLAAHYGVAADALLVTRGSSEAIDMLIRSFCRAGQDEIIICPPTFGMYSFDAGLQNATVIDVWRRADFGVDVEGVEEKWRSKGVEEKGSSSPKLLFLTSPNNPSGTWLPDAELKRLLALPLLVVLDEAYVEFADQPSRASWVLEHDNLVILRTFSKAAGIAGLRLGYGICPLWLMEALWKFKQPYNVNVAAAVAGIASLRYADQIMAVVEKLKAERVRLMNALDEIDFLRPHPSESNFILCDVVGRSGADVKQALEKQGVLVRYYSKPRLENCIRISVGRPDQTDRLLHALRGI